MKPFKNILLIVCLLISYNSIVYAENEHNDTETLNVNFDENKIINEGEVYLEGEAEKIKFHTYGYCFLSYKDSGEVDQNNQHIIWYNIRCYDIQNERWGDTFTYDRNYKYYNDGEFSFQTDDNNESSNDLQVGFTPAYAITSSIPKFNEDDEDFEDKLHRYFVEHDKEAPDDGMPEPPPEHNDNVELPQNFKCVSGYKYNFQSVKLLAINRLDKDIVYTWLQTVDTSNYKYEVDVKFKYSNYNKETVGYDEYTTDWFRYDLVDYKGSKNITLNLSYSVLNGLIKNDAESKGIKQNLGYYPAGGIDSIDHVIVRVRNICDGQCSNYVMSDIDITNKKVNNSETDENDITVDDAQYDNDDGTKDSSEQANIDITRLNDYSGILSYIKSGFGLFDKSGLLAFFKKYFNGIVPENYWKLVITGTAVIIVIGIINFLLKR